MPHTVGGALSAAGCAVVVALLCRMIEGRSRRTAGTYRRRRRGSAARRWSGPNVNTDGAERARVRRRVVVAAVRSIVVEVCDGAAAGEGCR